MPSLRDEITKSFFRFCSRFQANGGVRPDDTIGLALRQGQTVATYSIVRKLGAGGMAQVYLAFDSHLGRHVALKLLPPELTGDSVFLQRFKQEARTASGLNHPNILTIYNFLQLDGTQIIVSEFVEGCTLRTALEHGAIDIGSGLDIVCQVASALVAAHDAGVVHRDLKPTNIMIRPDGYVKVIDFGLAKLAERSEVGFTRPGSVLGTVGYMSPEQARGEEVDERTDLWSLGVILYEIVAGRPPFEGRTDNHLIVAILDDPPRPLPEGLPSGIASIIGRGLEKDREKRYPSARALLADLENVRRPSKIHAVVRVPRRRRSHASLFWGTFVAFLAAVAVWWWLLGGGWNIFGPRWVDYDHLERITFEGNVQLATISPDGRSLAFTVPAGGGEQLKVRDLSSRADRALPVSPGRINGITFSPDSKSLFYVVRDPKKEMGILYAVPMDSVEQTPPRLLLGDLDGPVTFSPDGRSFAFVRRADTQGRDSIMVASENNAHEVHSILSLDDTEISTNLAWTSGFGLAAVTYPARLRSATSPTLLLLSAEGHVKKRISIQELRTLRCPVSIRKNELLVFAARKQGSEQWHLLELSVPTGAVRELRGEPASFDSVSGTSDGATLAAVRLDNRSSLWISDATSLNNASRITPETENYDSVAWLPDGRVVVPSTRTGSVNLAAIAADGRVSPLSSPRNCVERQPAVSAGSSWVLYSSNCAHGGNDFNIWRMDVKTGKHVPLTTGPNVDRAPDVSADGLWAVYTSATFGLPSIWKLRLAGGTPRQLTSDQARNAVISPDSTRVLCQIRQPGSEWTVAILSLNDGKVLQRFPSMPVNTVMRWSPDGNALDYTVNTKGVSELWRQPLNGDNPTKLMGTGEGTISAFAWNANGTKLAYVRSRAESDVVLLQRFARN